MLVKLIKLLIFGGCLWEVNFFFFRNWIENFFDKIKTNGICLQLFWDTIFLLDI